MTQERLLEIIVDTKSRQDNGLRHIDKSRDGSKLQSEAVGAYTSLSHILSILRSGGDSSHQNGNILRHKKYPP